MLRKAKIILKSGKKYLSYKIRRPSPFSCTFYLNYGCNLSCVYCPFARKTKIEDFEKEKKNKFEVSTKEAKYIIDQLDKAGITVLSLTGGEPLLRDDLEEIAFYAKKKNILTVLHTNATLITKERAENIGKAFDSVVVSLAGRPETNDRLRGKDNFRKVMDGAELLRKTPINVKINLNCLIDKESFNDIDYVFNFAKEKFDSIAFLPIEYFPERFLNKETACQIERKIMKLKKENSNFITNPESHINLFSKHLSGEKHKIECDAFKLYISVSPKGDLGGCSMYPYSVGNLFGEDIKQLIEKGIKNREELFSRCGGCLGTIRVSLLFRQPIYKNIPVVKNIAPKLGLIWRK